MRRRLLTASAAAVAVAALAIALGGCITIKTQATSQRVAGVISLQLGVCASDDDASVYDACDSTNPGRNTQESHNSGDADADGLGQLLVGFRVPAGTIAPSSFPSVTSDVFFNGSPSYTAALNANLPPPAGARWFGYISTPKLFDIDDPDALQTGLRPEFTLPPQPGGAPFAGRFPWRAVVGVRPLADQGDAGKPVTCSELCFDSPTTARVTTDLTAAVGDFGVMTGASVTAGHEETATVAFPVRYLDGRGRGPQTVSLSATTTLPGSRATSATTQTLAPNGTTAVHVTVPVPPATPLGSYTVTLTAAAGSPAVTRSNTATIRVTDKLAPSIRIGRPADRAAFRFGRAIAADYACADETNGAGLATCAGPVAPGAAIDTGSLGRRTFRVDAADNAGNAATASRTYTVLPRRAPVIILAFDGTRSATATTFTRLLVKRVPKGSTVTARCRTKGRDGRCPAKPLVRRKTRGAVKLTKFVGRPFARGTEIDVRVTRAGTISAVKLMRIRGGRAPSIVTRCLPPGAKQPRKRC